MQTITRRCFIAGISLLCAVMLVGCAGQKADSEEIANPFRDCETLEDAKSIAGFAITVPDTAVSQARTSIQAVRDSMIQVTYGDGDSAIMVRKGSGSEDISGDYNEYSSSSSLDANGQMITVRGDGETVHVITWTAAGYTYAIDCNGGIENSDVIPLVLAIS
jgi:hypothetical protein